MLQAIIIESSRNCNFVQNNINCTRMNINIVGKVYTIPSAIKLAQEKAVDLIICGLIPESPETDALLANFQGNSQKTIRPLFLFSLPCCQATDLNCPRKNCQFKASRSTLLPACTHSKKMHPAIRSGIQYISSHYAENIHLKDLADFLYLSPQYLSELFKNETGISFSQYICRYRINIAKDLLQLSSAKIKLVSQKVGYTDPKAFSKVFKKLVGLSPKEFQIAY